MRQFGIKPQHPDKFILRLLELAPGLVLAATRDHLESLKNPPKTVEQYLNALEAQGPEASSGSPSAAPVIT